MTETPEASGPASLQRAAADAEDLQRAFDRLLSGAWSDLREAMALLHASEQRCGQLAADLERERSRRVVRWADKVAGIAARLRRRSPGRR